MKTLAAILLWAALPVLCIGVVWFLFSPPTPPRIPEAWELMKIVPQTRCFPPGTLGVGFPCIDKLMDSVIQT